MFANFVNISTITFKDKVSFTQFKNGWVKMVPGQPEIHIETLSQKNGWIFLKK